MGETEAIVQAEKLVDGGVPKIEVDEDHVSARLGQGHRQIRGRRGLVFVLERAGDRSDADEPTSVLKLEHVQPVLEDPERLAARTCPLSRVASCLTPQGGGRAWEPDRAAVFPGGSRNSSAERTRVSSDSRTNASAIPSASPTMTPSNTLRLVCGCTREAPSAGPTAAALEPAACSVCNSSRSPTVAARRRDSCEAPLT